MVREMRAILLSIKPEYVEKIFDGTKKYEYRKTKCKEKVGKINIYKLIPSIPTILVIMILIIIPSALVIAPPKIKITVVLKKVLFFIKTP